MKYAIIFASAFFCGCVNVAPGTATLEKGDGNLVFQRNASLEAWRMGAIKPIVLRQKFLDNSFGDGTEWSFSRDGSKLAFAATPTDVDFFDAGAYRNYLFTAYYNSHQKLQFAGYGPKNVDKSASYDYSGPSFDASGTEIVATEGEIGQFAEDSSHRWLAIYSLKTRQRLFDSRKFIAALTASDLKKTLGSQRFFAPSLAPNGRDLVCFATFDDGDTYSDELTPGKSAPPTLLIHFDLTTMKARILQTIDDQLSVGRLTYKNGVANSTLPPRTWPKTLAWQPNNQGFVFSAPKAANDARLNLFTCDLKSGAIARLSDTEKSDFCPQFSANGKSLFWIRGAAAYDKARENRVMRADANGQNAREFWPQIRGVQHLQVVAQLAPWEKFPKLTIAPLAGRDQ